MYTILKLILTLFFGSPDVRAVFIRVLFILGFMDAPEKIRPKALVGPYSLCKGIPACPLCQPDCILTGIQSSGRSG